MRLLSRIWELFNEDLTALVPGSSSRLDRPALLRLMLYVGLLVFIVSLFTIGRAPADRSDPFAPDRQNPPTRTTPPEPGAGDSGDLPSI